MSGNKIGGAKAAVTNKDRWGEDFYKRIGTAGGKVPSKPGKPKGFAYNNKKTLWQKLLGKPSRAALAGQKGGTISRRTKAA